MKNWRHPLDRRAFLQQLAAWAAVPRLISAGDGGSAAGEVLYNGIRLANPWPPIQRSLPLDPLLPPYLADPPRVIPIDVGRQLFVDDFLIEERTVERTYHTADYWPRNPVLTPTTRWEKFDEYAQRTNTRSNPTAMVFSDGVFYDPHDTLFKMWYMGGLTQNTCYATSDDGITWTRPSLDIVAGTNIVWSGLRDSNTVWLDHNARTPNERFKMASYDGSEKMLLLYESPDGVHWRMVGRRGPTGDRSTFFFNPFRRMWVYSIRGSDEFGHRLRLYWETPVFDGGTPWPSTGALLWTAADRLDPRRPELDVPPQLYNLDCVAYESLIVGLFTIWRGERDVREKPNDLVVGFSRDGFYWWRPDRRPFIGVSEHVGDWNWANVQSAGGVCLVVGDRLHFYVSGRRGVPGTNTPGVCSTGLATLRRDGFASLAEAPPDARVRRVWPSRLPTVTTRPLRFSGGFLFVNADARSGDLLVEVLDEAGRIIEPFSAANCASVRGDATKLAVTWAGGSLAMLAGQTVRFRFILRGARLYSFWVSRSTSGASGGYVAAGGPGFAGPIDDAR